MYILEPATTAPCWCLAAGGFASGPPSWSRFGLAHRPGARSRRPAGRSARTTPPLPRCRRSVGLRGTPSSFRACGREGRVSSSTPGVVGAPSPSSSAVVAAPPTLAGVRKPSSSRASESSPLGCRHHPGTSSSSSLTYSRMASNASILPRLVHVSCLARSSALICHRLPPGGHGPLRACASSAYSRSLVSSLNASPSASAFAALTAAWNLSG
mmetsp:Transcript_8959/g.36621  ORF Transcript_8959/g.36621 Transcript_8959/m.36621 type:complete len:212 (-) Transcript_8959:45-680(-)